PAGWHPRRRGRRQPWYRSPPGRQRAGYSLARRPRPLRLMDYQGVNVKALLKGAMAAALLASTAAKAQMKPEEMVETREAGYQFMAWNMGKIKAQVIDGKEAYDQAKVAAAAN